MRPAKPEICPVCGASVPPKAGVCPGCGSCEETGWSGEAYYDQLDLPDDEFDYDEFIQNEFGSASMVKPRGIGWFWWIIAVLVALMMFWFFFPAIL
ncbi:MAG: hypothetical protein K9N52_06370 [Verrucomicrobia bacterium]|nr:hypothetical protein [Verrucomicrobiota bacterium]